jgi:thioredoxin-related protein
MTLLAVSCWQTRLPQLLMAMVLFLAPPALRAAEDTAASLQFDDAPLAEPLEHPAWFKQSFLELPEDLRQAAAAGKRGIAVYFGQRRCPYCKMLLEHNFGQPDIEAYTRQHFDVIAVDIWGVQELTDIDGKVLTEREFALREGTNFTPSLIFYDAEGKVALRLRGYYPPYKFRAALEYVADGHYRREPFNAYLARGDSTLPFEPGDLIEEPFFIPPPHNLDRSRIRGERPLVVFFEQGECHACDVLHTQPVQERAIRELFYRFDTVQLDMRADTPVITPDGRKTTARQWADELGLFYAPSLLFFDEAGREIIRVDSVVRFFRLRNVLNYVLGKGYLDEPNYQRWRVGSDP